MGNAGHAYMVVAGLRFDTSSASDRQPLDGEDALAGGLRRAAPAGL